MNTSIIGAIADDLTGVSDTGAQFATLGLRTVGAVGIDLPSGYAEAKILNTQSRCAEPKDAEIIFEKAARAISVAHPQYILKKIDTALRGNIGIEVASLMETLDYRMAFFIGAIPKIGRTTINGNQLYYGVPIRNSLLGSDSNNPNPVFTSDIQELFLSVPQCRIEKVALPELRSKRYRIVPPENGFRKIIIFDVETDDDLDEAVRVTATVSDPFLYIGSLGLAESLGKMVAAQLNLENAEPGIGRDFTGFDYQRVLFVSGSPNPNTEKQIQYFKTNSPLEFIEAVPISLINNPRYLADLKMKLEKTITRDGKAFLYLKTNAGRLNNRSADLSKTYAGLIGEILESAQIDALVINGGETAYWICRMAGIENIEVKGAISVVAAYGRPSLSKLSDLKLIVTKGGSVGELAIFEKILHFLE
jgi:uncharacterized protein YgbK (DUF1537 family)